MKNPEFLGIVDVGSNTFNFLLAKTEGEHVEVLHQDRSPVMLGKGSHETKRIQPEAEQRAQQALLDFKTMAAHVGPIQWKGVATAALRYAQNGAEVAERLFQKTGIPIHIISGEQEAEYIFKGVQTHLNFGKQNGLIMDVGGASTEFIAFGAQGLAGLWSFPIGATRLHEILALTDPLLPEQVPSTYAWLEEQIAPMHDILKHHKPEFLVGSSGFFDTLVQMESFRKYGHGNESYSSHQLTDSCIAYWTNRLIPTQLQERLQIPGMLEFRAPMFLASILQVNFILQQWAIPHVHCTRISLKEGVLADWLHERKQK